jgi:hypothetical protein
MSFEISVGYFFAATRLIKNVILALRRDATLEYQELELELYALQRALTAIEHLKPGAGQDVTVNAVKVAALMCWHPLEEFNAK